MAFSSSHSPRSLVNNYELTLLEATKFRHIPGNFKLYKCFEIFDKIIPMLGQYKRVMEMIRDEVYEAVFSRQYTVDVEPSALVRSPSTDKGSTSFPKGTSIERIPYFEVLNKIEKERNKRAEIAEEQVELLKSVEENLHKEITGFKMNVSDMESALAKQQQEIYNLKSNLVAKEKERNELDIELRLQQQKWDRKAKDFEISIENLNEELGEERSKVNDLNQFKKCHDQVENDFRDPTAFTPLPQTGLFSAKEQKLRKDIAEGTTLEEQLLQLRNTCIEEYDKHLEKCQDGDSRAKEQPLQSGKYSKGKKRENYNTGFVNMINSIENELTQNLQHLSILKSDLEKINAAKRKSKRTSENLRGKSTGEESEMLEFIKDTSMNYKFVPQEPVLSKYALVVLYSCNQGNTYQELPDVQECKSCAAKTIVCPHRATTGKMVFHLPLQCTHIKFTRPEVQIPCSSQPEYYGKTSNIPKERNSSKLYPKLWNDLILRESTSCRRIPRILKEEFLVSLIKQFYASVVLDDTDGHEKPAPLSMLETWHAFLKNRYLSNTVAFLVARDVLETVQSSVTLHPFIQMFVECLCGKLDPTAFRYYLTLRCLVQIVFWSSFEDFTAFSNIIYPFMDVDELEQFTMSFRSFSENKVDEAIICEFFLSLVLKQREPAFHDMESRLLQRPGVSAGVMTDIVFFESVAEISPLSSERLCLHLYSQSKANTEGDHVSITRLSQIASYLVIHEQYPVMDMELRKKLRLKVVPT